MMEVTRTIKYDADRVKGFGQEVMSVPGCEEAATVPVGALTAWNTVIDTANVQPGQRMLVHGAAGGVGLYAAQFARWKGAQVIGTGSAANLEFVRSLGIEAVDYGAGPFEKKVWDMDAVIDTVANIQQAIV